MFFPEAHHPFQYLIHDGSFNGIDDKLTLFPATYQVSLTKQVEVVRNGRFPQIKVIGNFAR